MLCPQSEASPTLFLLQQLEQKQRFQAMIQLLEFHSSSTLESLVMEEDVDTQHHLGTWNNYDNQEALAVSWDEE